MKVFFTEEDYPFSFKRNSSLLQNIVDIFQGRGWQISFLKDYTLRDLLGFNSKPTHDEYDLSDKPDDILLFDNSFQ